MLHLPLDLHGTHLQQRQQLELRWQLELRIQSIRLAIRAWSCQLQSMLTLFSELLSFTGNFSNYKTKNFLANNNFLDEKDEFLSRYDLQNHSKQIGKYAKRREEQMPLLTMSELVSGGIKKSQFYNLKLKIQRKIRLIYIFHCLTKLLFESKG